MLDEGEESAHSSESESESMEVPGERTPPSEGSKEEKAEVPGEGNGNLPHGPPPEIIIIDEPKPRASVLEYKSVSQMYVLQYRLMHPLHGLVCLQFH